MNKNEIQKLLLQALAQQEYWRNKYNRAFLFDAEELANYKKWSAKVTYLESL